MSIFVHILFIQYFIHRIYILYIIFAHMYLLTHFYSHPCWFKSICTLMLFGPSVQHVLLGSSAWGDSHWAWAYSCEGNWCQKKSLVTARCSLTGWKYNLSLFLVACLLSLVLHCIFCLFVLFCFSYTQNKLSTGKCSSSECEQIPGSFPGARNIDICQLLPLFEDAS